MNELMIVLETGHLYYKTESESAEVAYREFENVCDNAGINIDNLPIIEAILRDEEGYDIDTFTV